MKEGPPSFENDVRSLFREKDRSLMQWAFDLWAHADVRDNAPQILQRLEDGDMPCDEPWPKDRIEAFRSWMRAGMQP
ncbi:MAG: hypothetical protein H0W27_05685 [Actinobacteria bacterium]|nr:hypothetical protein [Actinomycetota bacterium]